VAWRHKDQSGPPAPPAPPPTVRVLHGDAELAAAAERAAEGERRLRARLDARAARDAWTAQQRTGDGRRGVGGRVPGRSQATEPEATAPRNPAA